jgi:2-haloacid dehalogenase
LSPLNVVKETVMAVPNLRGIRACVFDAYGTLFDFASAASACSDVLGDQAVPLTALWRDKQLQYTWLRAVQGRHADFWQVTGDALDFALEALRLGQGGLRERLMTLYLTLDAFPEVAEVLRRLRAAGLGTAILSNGSPAMLRAAIENAGLADLLDLALSVEEVGVYKPHPKVYQLAVDRLGMMPGGNPLPVVQRVGRLCRLGLRYAHDLVQPLWPGPRAPARCARSRDPLAGRFAGAARRLNRRVL